MFIDFNGIIKILKKRKITLIETLNVFDDFFFILIIEKFFIITRLWIYFKMILLKNLGQVGFLFLIRLGKLVFTTILIVSS